MAQEESNVKLVNAVYTAANFEIEKMAELTALLVQRKQVARELIDTNHPDSKSHMEYFDMRIKQLLGMLS